MKITSVVFVHVAWRCSSAAAMSADSLGVTSNMSGGATCSRSSAIVIVLAPGSFAALKQLVSASRRNNDDRTTCGSVSVKSKKSWLCVLIGREIGAVMIGGLYRHGRTRCRGRVLRLS